MRALKRGLVGIAAMVALATVSMGAISVVAKPEDVGMSSDRLRRIHGLIYAHIRAKDFSGAVTLVARRGKVVHFEVHGDADIEAKKPMRADTLFRLASMTKPVTAVAILMLVEEGKLVLSDPVSKFLPEFKHPKVAVWTLPNDASGAGPRLVPAAREITIQDLLTHTSGLANGGEGPAGDYVRKANLPSGGSLDERVRRLAPLPLNFQPGSQWEYSPGTGFDTLGRVVEILSGTTLDQFFKSRIFDPLGMKDTFFTVPSDRQADLAVLYTKGETGLARPERQAPTPQAASGPYFSGAGGLTGSTSDYLTFASMLLNGGQANGVRLLSRKTVELMTANAIGSLDLRNYAGDQVLKGYGFGLGVRVRRDTGDSGWMGSVGDFGWAGAFGTYFWIDPKEQLIGLVMIQTRNTRLRMEFPNLVYQAVSD
ncbi:MAG: beta-lactamase family protein [Acidimicrobiia bacterium]|nr:beta-lactamase family protein [Acidimicrobiia bacterium]